MGSSFGSKCFFGSLSKGVVVLLTGGYGMVYKLQRPADFVISRKPNLLITLCSGVLLPLQIWWAILSTLGFTNIRRMV
jgi:hypothetical protein